jgi:hypothetical protein
MAPSVHLDLDWNVHAESVQSLVSLAQLTVVCSSICEALTRFVQCVTGVRLFQIWTGPKDDNNMASEAPTIVTIKRTRY